MIDIVGKTFNRLTVIKEVERNNFGQRMFLCECSCENKTKKIIRGNDIKNEYVKSCGCLQKEKTTKHGDTNKRLWRIWRGMVDRCTQENHADFNNYGGRGIKVCEEWANKDEGYINFKKWAIENGYSEKLTIDRIEVNKGYSPDNCKWATNKDQQNNKRNNVYITINNSTKTLMQWSEESGINFSTLQGRLRKGISGEELLKPVKKRKKE